MTSLDRLLCSVLAAVLLLVSAWFGIRHYGAEQYQVGHAAAIAAGRAQLERDTAAARKTETDLRAQLRAKDDAAFTKEKEYATNLAAAQRRMRAGDDRLRCPGAVPAATQSGDRSAAAGLAADGEGPEIVPEVAAEILGDAADVAGLVRRYERVVERFEACRTVNEK
ncbi:hypothetical protein [Massilia sp. UBA6681]|uniref:hypothetical protein n=1 Tax=Massilia sp. UBA6681 TaxID=1946839 RepID=UPI0025C27A18|nr:hypothetical protein [Massilia sp. UBA6681]